MHWPKSRTVCSPIETLFLVPFLVTSPSLKFTLAGPAWGMSLGQPSPSSWHRCQHNCSLRDTFVSTGYKRQECPGHTSSWVALAANMRTILVISLLSCFFAAYNAKVFSKCELARQLKAHGMDGFHGYSLANCEYELLIHPFCLCPKWPSSPTQQTLPKPASSHSPVCSSYLCPLCLVIPIWFSFSLFPPGITLS